MALRSGKSCRLPVAEILSLPQFQNRSLGLQLFHTTDLAAAMEEGANLPRIRVWEVTDPERFPDGPTKVVTNGHHTLQAHVDRGEETIACELLTGSYNEAMLDAARANWSQNALTFTGKDKERAVRLYFQAQPNAAAATVAKDLKFVSVNFVATVKREMKTGKSRKDERKEKEQTKKAKETAKLKAEVTKAAGKEVEVEANGHQEGTILFERHEDKPTWDKFERAHGRLLEVLATSAKHYDAEEDRQYKGLVRHLEESKEIAAKLYHKLEKKGGE